MIEEIADIHIAALPHTFSSKLGRKHVSNLYKIIQKIGYIKIVKRNQQIVGAIAGINNLILTLIVHPSWQRQGIGRELLGMLKGKQFVYTERCSVGFYEKMGFDQCMHIGKIYFLCRK